MRSLNTTCVMSIASEGSLSNETSATKRPKSRVSAIRVLRLSGYDPGGSRSSLWISWSRTAITRVGYWNGEAGLRALVTRPREEAESLIPALATRGIGALIEPLMEIHYQAP